MCLCPKILNLSTLKLCEKCLCRSTIAIEAAELEKLLFVKKFLGFRLLKIVFI